MRMPWEPNVYGGVKMIITTNAVRETSAPVKKHKLKKWMSGSYHLRIQKKWVKRFGYVMEPCAYQTEVGIIIHPELAKKLERVVKERG